MATLANAHARERSPTRVGRKVRHYRFALTTSVNFTPTPTTFCRPGVRLPYRAASIQLARSHQKRGTDGSTGPAGVSTRSLTALVSPSYQMGMSGTSVASVVRSCAYSGDR